MATILVMDDDAYMRELMGLHLSNAGYDVLVAEDAIVAGHLVLQKSPDLILADIEMPFMNGLEFVQALKADHSISHTPVIFVSSRDDLEDLAKSFGAVAFLKKPVLADQLLAAVAQEIRAGITVRP
jgi:DNA-binding response OmpR family regulator